MIYRKEIDGLRAIAVLAVIIYHAQFMLPTGPFLPGGFLGVDIFFVISGYLIAKIIFVELDSTNRLNILAFYERRARRILPALILVSLATLSLGWLYQLPDDFLELSSSVISSFLFVSNFYFYFQSTAYGADSALLEPFLHTWSLSVEEQFYLVFPLLALALHLWQRKRQLAWFAGIALISFAGALVLGRLDSDLNFYMPLTRVWELLAGAMLAHMELRNSKIIALGRSRHWIPALGLTLIIVPLVLIQFLGRHPGLVTLAPVAGTAILLATCSPKDPIGRLLASRPAAFIGLISYSLYLWHYPIFAFGRMMNETPSILDRFLWIALTCLLSVLSYAFVERPFRKRQIIGGPAFGASLGAGLGLVFALNATVLLKGGFPLRVPEGLRPYTGSVGYRTLAIDGVRCHSHPDGICVFPIKPNLPLNIILTGDSHADSLSNDLFAKLKERSIGRFAQMSVSGCPIMLGFAVEGRKSCTAEQQKRRLKLIKELGHKGRNIVIYFARTPAYLTGKRFDGGEGRVEGGAPFRHLVEGNRTDNLVKTLNLIAQDNELLLVYPMPEIGAHVQRYFLKSMGSISSGSLKRALSIAPLDIPYDVFMARAKSSFAALDLVKIPKDHRIYPHALFCNSYHKGKCVAHNSRRLFYTDSNHPNFVSASMINDEILKVVDRLIAAPANDRPG